MKTVISWAYGEFELPNAPKSLRPAIVTDYQYEKNTMDFIVKNLPKALNPSSLFFVAK
jgi:hypothetical protein